MSERHNSVGFCENNNLGPIIKSSNDPLESKEVITTSASVQAQDCEDSSEQICSNAPSLEQDEFKIKTECEEIYIEETNISNMIYSEDSGIKKEGDSIETQSDLLPLSFADVNCDMKLEYDNVTLKDPLRSVPLKHYKCNICHIDFSGDKKKFERHYQTHLEDKPYKCDLCEKGFADEYKLKNHMQIHAPAREKAYKCNVCSKAFYRGSHLNAHRKKHAGEKCYECIICKKDFFTSSDLKIHYRTHTGEKPFKCNICNRGFSQKCALKAHLKTHVPYTITKFFKCDVCEMIFYNYGGLKTHLFTQKH